MKGEKVITIILVFSIAIGLFSYFERISIDLSDLQSSMPMFFLVLAFAMFGSIFFVGGGKKWLKKD